MSTAAILKKVQLNRHVIFIYGIVCYAAFLLTLVYAIAFVANLPLAPHTLDGTVTRPWHEALAIDLALLALFAIQHSVMARPAFKRWWTRWIPEAAERSTYVLFSSLALLVLFQLWEPIGGTIWNTTNPVLRTMLHAIYAAGWLVIFVASLFINHFDLFGLRQVTLCWQQQTYTHLPFATPGPYAYVRHPLYVGWFMAFWATPTMTVTHLIFAVVTTLYILAAVRLEERDLSAALPEYAAYRQVVPRFFPRLRWRRPVA